MIYESKIDTVKEQRSPIKIIDVAIIAFLLILSVTLLLTLYRRSGEKVVISYGDVTEQYDLNENREIYIEDKLTVCIENGFVYVKDAQCSDKICMRTGKVNKVGETIVCAPFSVTVRIIGGSGGNRVVTG